ncbi:MAG: diguanylate cyclase [Magnetococcales bacterium]|nr:diguanylate cyclase [Magnetococcales bacterium]
MESQSPSKTIRILLVDDQPLTGHLLKRMISQEPDMLLYSCTDPCAAIQLAEKEDPTVILLDFIMPELDGLTLLKQFRSLQRFAHIPIILLSSQSDAECKAQAFRDGANDYLVKLPDAVEMLARLRYHGEGYLQRLKHRLAQQALIESEHRFRMVTQSISEAIVSFCPDGMIHFWNRGAENVFGYKEFEVFDRPISLLVPKEYLSQYARMFFRLRPRRHILAPEGVSQGVLTDKILEMVGVRKNGEQFPMEISLATWQTDGTVHYAAVIRDITERKQAEERIRYQAHFDLLTDLPNRNLFLTRLDENLAVAGRQQKLLALLFIDLDRFKWVNDNLGHEAGDDLLQQAARRMKSCVRKSDTVARLGGDEFTMVLFDVADVPSTVRVAENVLKQLATPFLLSGQEVSISGSIGITFYPADGTDREELLRNADHAMYIAKRSGRNAYWLFNPDQHSA